MYLNLVFWLLSICMFYWHNFTHEYSNCASYNRWPHISQHCPSLWLSHEQDGQRIIFSSLLPLPSLMPIPMPYCSYHSSRFQIRNPTCHKKDPLHRLEKHIVDNYEFLLPFFGGNIICNCRPGQIPQLQVHIYNLKRTQMDHH